MSGRATAPEHQGPAPAAAKNGRWSALGRFAPTESAGSAILVTVLAFVTALAIGALVIVFSDPAVLSKWGYFLARPGDALSASWNDVTTTYGALFSGSLGSPSQIVHAVASGNGSHIQQAFYPLSETIVAATPLMFTGLAVALAFRAGLFNIGAEGQLFVGGLVAGLVGFQLHLPPGIHLVVALAAGFVGGAVWGFIPGFLKARTGAHEVITTIMMNYIAISLSYYLLATTLFRRPGRTDPISKIVLGSARLPHLAGANLRVHSGIILAALATGAVAWLLSRSTFGFELRAVGLNPNAARTAGMNIGRTYILVMVLAGGLAGLGGANQVLGVQYTLAPGFSAGLGFDAITLALLGRANPWGVFAAALLFGMLRAGAVQMQAATGTPVDMVVVIQSLIIVFVAAPALVRAMYRIKVREVGGTQPVSGRVERLMATSTANRPGPFARPGAAAASGTRSRVLGFIYVGLGLFIAFAFGGGAGDARFQLNLGQGAAIHVPDLVLAVRPAVLVLAAVCVGLGAAQLARGFGRRTNVVLGVVAAIFVFAFLTWAARGSSVNLVGILQSTLLRAVPLTLGALCGVLCERSGVIDVAIEGQFLIAAFAGALVGSAAQNSWVGLAAGVVSGGLVGAILAVLTIRYQVDQIIVGVVLDVFALGITGFLFDRLLVPYQSTLNSPTIFGPIEIPVLSKIPIIGSVLFDQSVFVYLMLALVAIIQVALFRTRYGLRVRAVGEHPQAADTVGINVARVRYRNVILGGLVAGVGGAYFTLGSVGSFDKGMTAGRGFIALAAMIVGRWSPMGAFAAALVFGFADALQSVLAILNVPIPSQFLLMTPYVVTILVVAGVVGRARPPAADGKPYVKE